MNQKSHQFTVRLSPEQRAALEQACKDVGIDAATITRALLSAFIEHVQDEGTIQLPLKVVPAERKNTDPGMAHFMSTVFEGIFRQTDMQRLNELIWKSQEGDSKAKAELLELSNVAVRKALGKKFPEKDAKIFVDGLVKAWMKAPKRPFKIVWGEEAAREAQGFKLVDAGKGKGKK